MKKPTVIVYSDHPQSVCSFWRSHGVMSYLSRDDEINLIEGSWGDSWDRLQFANIAFFQRPMTKDCLEQICMAKDVGLKVIIDLDDHNVIPESHPVYKEYMGRYDESSFIKIMMLADLVIVSTEYLKSHYSRYSSNVSVVPNAINNNWLNARPLKKTKTVFLRGGEHHEADIYHYKDEIIEVMNSHPEWTLEVAGSDPVFLREEIENYKYVGDLDIHTYFAYILQSNASVFIHPFIDNAFNRSKSNIGWQEATLSGAVSLSPDWWKLDGVSYSYSDKEPNFIDGLKDLLSNDSLRESYWKSSLELLKKNYLLKDVNKKRLELIKSVL